MYKCIKWNVHTGNLLSVIHQMGSAGSSGGKESACNAGDSGLIPGLGRSPREGIGYPIQYFGASLGSQMVKNPPTMRETWVWSLGWEDSPGVGHGNQLQYSCLENPHGQGRLACCSPWGHKKSDTLSDWTTTAHTHTHTHTRARTHTHTHTHTLSLCFLPIFLPEFEIPLSFITQKNLAAIPACTCV